MTTDRLFVAGGPVRFDSPVYISREKLEDRAFQLIRGKRYLTIIAPRQMGKTSLLQNIQAISEKEYGYATVLMDLSVLNRDEITWERWGHKFCSEIARQLRTFCDDAPYFESPQSPDELTQFLAALSTQITVPHILILLDEASAIPEGIRDQFYSVIRSIHNQRSGYRTDKRLNRYNFVFAGVFEPEKLIKNRDNSPFNVTTPLRLRDFSFDEAEQLLKKLENIYPAVITAPFVKTIYAWTKGQPYLTQALASLVEDQLQIGETAGMLDDSLVESLIPELMDLAGNNINHVVSLATSKPDLKQMTYRIMRKNEPVLFSRNIPQHLELELAGLIIANERGECQIRNPLYEQALKPIYLHNKSEDRDGVSEVGLPFSIHKRLLATLLRCGPFSTHEELQTVFVDNRISQWRDELPEAKSSTIRVKMTITYLLNRHAVTGDNALVSFMNVLTDQSSPDDACYQDLADLTSTLEKMLG